MIRTACSLLLALPLIAKATTWEEVAYTDTTSVYVDTDTIEQTGSIATAWVKRVEDKPMITQVMIDCKRNSLVYLYVIEEVNGKVVNHPGDGTVYLIRDGSFGEAVKLFICGRKDKKERI